MGVKLSMRRDARALLWDTRENADAIVAFLVGRTRADYLRERQLRSAVEREFEITGEAPNKLAKQSPSLAAQVRTCRVRWRCGTC